MRIELNGEPGGDIQREVKSSQSSASRHRTGQPSILLAFDWFDHRIYAGIGRFALEANWHLSPYLFSDRSIPSNWPGDGAITSFGPTLGPFIKGLKMPKVDISVTTKMRGVPRVAVDNREVCRMAAEHFMERGFRHFAFFSWPTVEVNSLRGQLFREALLSAGVPETNIHSIEQPEGRKLADWTLYERVIVPQLELLPRPLAVFAGQDNLGASLIEVCTHHGIHIPEEVSVLGVDNIEFLCNCLAVPMSSIDTRLEELGYQAAHQLQRLLDGEISRDEPPLLVPPAGIVLRRSSDILAIPHAGVASSLKIMQTEFGSPLTIESICERVGMSKRGMEKAFLTHLRRSPADELRRIRMDHAKKTLAETDRKIEAIASESGYCNSSNLSLAFRRDTGMTPRAYRVKYGMPRKY